MGDDLPYLTASADEKAEKWKSWVSSQVAIRAMLGLYLLDGLLTDLTGQPTVVRHANNPCFLPSSSKAFDAHTADEWILCMSYEHRVKITFRELYLALFCGDLVLPTWNLDLPSLHVVVECINSYIHEFREARGPIAGSPSPEELARVLLHVHSTYIPQLPNVIDGSLQEIRWHVVCINLAVDPVMLNRGICEACSITQQLQTCGRRMEGSHQFPGWLLSLPARRAILHAIKILELIQTLPVGVFHSIHLPSAMFTAATIFSVALMSSKHNGQGCTLSIPKVVSWEEVWDTDGWQEQTIVGDSPVLRFLKGAVLADSEMTVHDMRDDLNTIQFLLLQALPCWGVAKEMIEIIEGWTTVLHTMSSYLPVP